MVATLDKILRKQKIKGQRKNQVIDDAMQIQNALSLGNTEYFARRSPHKATIRGEAVLVVDATPLNRYMNQGGRGQYRLAFDPDTYNLLGVAKHSPSGSYHWA